jgi:release factor glutamine methyltransferase
MLKPVADSLFALVIAGRERLVNAGLAPDLAAVDAEVLAREALAWDRAQYLARRGDPAPDGFAARFDELISRREAREPVSQILGRREFWGREFIVTRDVLTPRPETELIVEAVLERWPAGSGGPHRVADIGTGSGCLAVTLALEWPGASLVATDISEPALRVARANVERYGLRQRVLLVRGDLADSLAPGLDLIVSNPPYVPADARDVLPPEVGAYEPPEALFGGHNGFDLIESLLDRAVPRLAPHGRLVMEFGAGQDDRMRAIVAARPSLELLEIRDDFQGIPRVAVIGRRRAEG